MYKRNLTAGENRIRTVLINAAAATLLSVAVPAFAGGGPWYGSAANDNWSEATNWAYGAAPTIADQVYFDQTDATTTRTAATNIVDVDHTIDNILYTTNFASGGAYHWTQINTGVTLSITGGSATTGTHALFVGSRLTGTTGQQSYYTISGGGTLNVNNASASIGMYEERASGSATRNATLDLSGLSTFNANIFQLRVNADPSPLTGTTISRNGTMILGDTNTITTAPSTTVPGLMVGVASGAGAVGNALLRLGRVNNINSDVIVVGGHRSSSTLNFNAGLTSPTATIRGSAGGTARVTFLTIGDNAALTTGITAAGGTSQTSTGVVDLSAGSVDALIDTLIVGRAYWPAAASNAPAGTGTFTFAAGTVDVNNVQVGVHSTNVNPANGVGTINVNGIGTLTVNNDMLLTRKVGSATPTATLNVNNTALVNVKGNILDSGGTSTINLNGGTIDLDPDAGGKGNLTVDNLNLYGGLLKNPAAVTVGTLRGFGAVQSVNSVTVSTALIPGQAATANTSATLAMAGANLTLNTGATATFSLGTATTPGGPDNDLVDGVADLTLNNNTLTVLPFQPLTAGSYRLINYTGTKTGSMNPTVTHSTRYGMSIDETTAGQINLNVTGTNKSLTWSGGTPTWDVNTTLAWDANAEKFFQGDDVLLDDTASTGTVNLAGTLYPAAIVFDNSTVNYVVQGAGLISGKTGIVKNGAGTVTLSNTQASDYTGDIVVNAGTLKLTTANVLGSSAGTTTIKSGATLDVAANLDFRNETIIVEGAGVGGNGAIINSSATGAQNAFRTVTLTGDTTFGGNARWDIGQGGSGAFNANNFNLTKVGPNEVWLVGLATTNLADVTINGGRLGFQGGTSMGDPLKTITVNNGATLGFYSNTVAVPLVKKIAMNDGSTIQQTNGAALLQGTVTLDGTTIWDVSGGTTLTVDSIIGGTGSLNKNSTATLRLNAINAYTGNTIVNAGTLALGPAASIATSPVIDVRPGATLDTTGIAGGYTIPTGQTIAGGGGTGTFIGTVLGNVTLGTGAALAPGNAAATGTLSFSNSLIASGGGTINLDLSSSSGTEGGGYNDLLVANDLQLSGTTTLFINPLGSLSGTYFLINYTTKTGGIANLAVNTLSRYNFTLDETTYPNKIVANVTGGTPATLEWAGGLNGNAWDIGSLGTANWSNAGVPDKFYQGDAVNIGDTANNTISLQGAISATTISFNASATDYTLVGPGKISGGTLNLYGGRKVTLANTGVNDTSGMIYIGSSSTLQIGNGGVDGSLPPGQVTGSGTLIFDRSNDVTVPNLLSGDVAIVKKGPNTLTFNLTDNTGYYGNMTVEAGTLRVSASQALGTSGNITIANGAVLDIGNIGGTTGTATGDRKIYVQGSGIGGTGAIITSVTNANFQNATRQVELTGDTTFGGVGRWDVRKNTSTLVGSFVGNGYKVTKVGTPTSSVVLVDIGETGIGEIDVVGGRLTFEYSSTMGDPTKTATVGDGATIAFYNLTTNIINKQLVMNGTSTLRYAASAAANTGSFIGPVTLNGSNVIEVNTAPFTMGGKITGPGSLEKKDNSTLILTAADNDWAGGTIITAGTLQIGDGVNPGSLPATGGILNNGTLAINSTDGNVVNYGGSITGSGSLTIDQGILKPANPVNLAALTFGSVTPTATVAPVTTAGGLDLTAGDGTFSSLITQNNNATGSSIILPAGRTLTINGAVTIGRDMSGAPNTNKLTIGSGGALVVNSPTGAFTVGTRTVNVNQLTDATLDLTTLASASIDVSNLFLGRVTNTDVTGAQTVGTLKLAVDNTITASTQVVVADSPSTGNTNFTSVMTIGSGNTTLTTPLVVIGWRKSKGMIDFAPGGTLTLNNGAAPTDLYLARNAVNSGSVGNGILDATGGTLVASFGTVVVGEKTLGGNGGATGTITLDNTANVVTANSLVLGRIVNAGANAAALGQGTLNFGGGTFKLAGNAVLGDWSDDSGTDGAARGTLKITGGVVTIAGDISKTDSDRSSAIIDINGGTLDMQNQADGDLTPGNITASQLALRSGSLLDVGSITLDGRGVTNGTTVGGLDHALILRDVDFNLPFTLTATTAGKGGILYEAAGGGTGGKLNIASLDLSVTRPFTVEDSAAASVDLDVPASLTGAGGLTKAGAGRMVLSGANTYAGDTRVNGGVLRTATVASLPGTGRVLVNSGALAQTGGTDPAATLAAIVNEVKLSRNGGAWDGTGRYGSEAAAADALKITGLGVILNNDGGVTPIQPAISTDPTDVLVKYTYNGDSDLDGVVDADDYFQIDAGFISQGTATPRSGWRWGDYNYDGVINIDDYFLIDVAYARQAGALFGGDLAPVAPTGPSTAVPEPGTLSLLALGAAALLGRRRRSK